MTNQSYTTAIRSIAGMPDFVDKELGISPWFDIKQDDINTFARITEDEQWIHVDTERARKESPFGTTIAHGFMILSLASKFCFETFKIEDVKMGLNYGLDRVRFMNPTLTGSKVRGRVSLLNVELIEGGAKYKLNVVFELDGQEKPACVAEFLGIAYN